MSIDLQLLPKDTFKTLDIQHNKPFTIDDGVLKDVGVNMDVTILLLRS